MFNIHVGARLNSDSQSGVPHWRLNCSLTKATLYSLENSNPKYLIKNEEYLPLHHNVLIVINRLYLNICLFSFICFFFSLMSMVSEKYNLKTIILTKIVSVLVSWCGYVLDLVMMSWTLGQQQ